MTSAHKVPVSKDASVLSTKTGVAGVGAGGSGGEDLSTWWRFYGQPRGQRAKVVSASPSA